MGARSFRFHKPGRLVDDDLELELASRMHGDPAKRLVPGYRFVMKRRASGVIVGRINLRIGDTRVLRYPGHVGYEVKARYRGHRYAARATRLLLPLARSHGLGAVWFSVEPRNVPSIRTCQILGARYMETIRVPSDHRMNRVLGMRYIRRYRLSTRDSVRDR